MSNSIESAAKRARGWESVAMGLALVVAAVPATLAQSAAPPAETATLGAAPSGPDLQALHAELAAAQAALAGAKADADRRAKELADAKTALAAAEAELKAQKEATAEAVKARTELDAQLLAARQEFASTKAALEQAQASVQAKADATATLEKGRADLEAQLKSVRDELAAARAAVEKAQADASAKAAALATAEQGRSELEKKLTAEMARFTAAEKAANDKLTTAEQAAAAKLAAAQGDVRTLADKLAAAERLVTETQERVTLLEGRLAAEEQDHVAMAAEIEALKSRVPASGGGTLTAERARAEAASAGEAFVAAERRARKERSDDAETALKAAAAGLRQAQFGVAVATDAQGVYRLRAEDTLGVVAARFYGSSKRWPVVFEANRHILANPDALVPGMSLVLP